jgi:aminopeptidase
MCTDLDPARVSRAQPTHSRARREVEYRVNSTIVPGPTEPWARSLRPHLAAAEALAALWNDVAVACRLGDPDPVAAWRQRLADLHARAQALTALRLDAVRLCGIGGRDQRPSRSCGCELLGRLASGFPYRPLRERD